ncbi:MAG: TraB/GumN family protein [Pseudomonadota bacterium]
MLQRVVAALCLGMLMAPAHCQTETEASEAAAEKILVVGQRPGPGLWKISRDGHVLWVFGLYSPLPRNMVWRSTQVETILAQSQEYLTAPSATAKLGFFRTLTLLPYAFGIRKNPDGAQLKDVLPAADYARWQVLKQKYIGNDEGIERERPIFVANTLFNAGLQHAGLSSGHEVNMAIDAIARKNKIKTTASDVKLEFDDPAAMIKAFKKSALDDTACFSRTLDRLETDIDAMQVRANAWAKGDLEAIQKLSYADREQACDAAVMDSALLKSQPGMQSLQVRMQQAWLAAAEASLAANATTFATLPIRNILDPTGYVMALQAKGYLVETPD